MHTAPGSSCSFQSCSKLKCVVPRGILIFQLDFFEKTSVTFYSLLRCCCSSSRVLSCLVLIYPSFEQKSWVGKGVEKALAMPPGARTFVNGLRRGINLSYHFTLPIALSCWRFPDDVVVTQNWNSYAWPGLHLVESSKNTLIEESQVDGICEHHLSYGKKLLSKWIRPAQQTIMILGII